MNDPKILLLTDDALAASKIIGWLDSWDYNVDIIGFGNELIFNDNTLKYDLILIDLPHKDNFVGMKALNTIKKFKGIPIICTSSTEDDNTIDFPETFFNLEKPVDPKELKLTVEMAIYRHQMEMALQDSERKYKLLVENADDPIAIVKNDGSFLLVNQSGAKYFGGVPDNFNGKNM